MAKISRGEYMMLMTAQAQQLAGHGKAPSPEQIALAEKMLKIKLAHMNVSVVGGCAHVDGLFDYVKKKIASKPSSMVGSFWDSVKTAAKKSAPVALPVLLPGAVATPFIIQAIKSKQAKQAKDALAKRAVAAAVASPTEEHAEDDLDLQQISGMGDIYKPPTYLQRGVEPDLRPVFFGGDGSFPAEERELALMGGASEMAALRRRLGPSRMRGMRGEPKIPNDLYRAAIWQRAQKMSGGASPGAKEVFVAKKSVDRALSRRGVEVQIPGGKPGRRTQ